MSFASYDFLFSFLPLAVLLIWAALFIDAKRLLIPAIIISSIVFYGYTSFPHLLLLLSLILATWVIGILYNKIKGTPLGALVLFIGVMLNLSSLLIWKYGSSFVEAWNMLGWIQAKDPGLIMPLGFDKRVDMAALGVAWIAIGLFKKAVIADSIGRVTIPMIVGASVRDLTLIQAWEIMLSSGARIYFDFSGYCDMAVGIGLLFGIKLPANFNAPMRLATISDGWRRWHITFHNFLRDHVYRHLRNLFGGSKVGIGAATVIVFLISALWHGNSVVFLVWGLVCGFSWLALTYLAARPSTHYRNITQISLAVALYMFLPLMFVVPDLESVFFVVGQLFAIDTLPQSLRDFGDQGGWYMGAILCVNAIIISEISTQVLLSDKYTHRDRTFFGYRPPIWAPNFKWALFITVLLVIGFYYVGKSPPFVYFRF